MNILVVSQYFYPETFRINHLCSELVRRGHSVTVLTAYPQYPQGKIYDGYGFRKPYDSKWNGVNIIRLKVRPRGKTFVGLLLNCLTFVTEGEKWVRKCKTKFDAVYVYEISPVTVGLPAVAYKKKFGTPLFLNVQDLWPENVEIVLGIHFGPVIKTINKIVDKIYNASNKILCSSRSFVDNIAARGIEKEKLVFWPQFCIDPDLENMTRPAIYSEDNFNIVFAGNIGNAQGLELLVDAAAQMNKSNVRWYLVGDGRAREHLQKRVCELGLEENVIFVGRVSENEANRYVHFADCAYLSFMDNLVFDMTIPAKMQTYLACGTPVLAAAGGESREIIKKSGCGISCERDCSEVVSAVTKLKADRKALLRMRENGRIYYQNNFEPDKLIDRLEEFFNADNARNAPEHSA